MSRAKLNPVLRGRCPLCHFEEFHLVSCQLGQSEAETARLQERVKGLEANRREAFSLIVSYSDEADEARALAERRKKALWEDKHAHDHANAHCTRCMNAQAKCRAAIDISPEEAGEKSNGA